MSRADLEPGFPSRFADTFGDPGEHPSAEDLVRYREGTLEERREVEVKDHLVTCDECAGLLLDLVDLEGVDGMALASEAEVENAWRRQRRRLFGVPKSGWRTMAGWAAAAALAGVAFVQSLAVQEMRRELQALYEQDVPRVVAVERLQRAGEKLPLLRLPDDSPALLLLLLRDDETSATFRADLYSEDGQLLMVREGLSLDEDVLVLQVAPGVLPSGVLRVTVSSGDSGETRAPRDYLLRVEHTP